MLKPEDTRRGVRQIDAVVQAMGALAPHEANAVRLAVAQCTADLQRRMPVQSAAVEPDVLALFAAYKAAALTPPRGFLAGVLKLTAVDTAAFCVRIRAAAEAVAAEQGRRKVLDGFKALDVAPSPIGPNKAEEASLTTHPHPLRPPWWTGPSRSLACSS